MNRHPRLIASATTTSFSANDAGLVVSGSVVRGQAFGANRYFGYFYFFFFYAFTAAGGMSM